MILDRTNSDYMSKIKQFKQGLARVFDDDLKTSQWHNFVDYFIIGLILLSTVQVFVSTFALPPAWETVMHWIDVITLIIFTIEVSLRIWAADDVNPKYKGFWGRVKYCFSFYGLIDVLSTYPFYLTYWIPIPYNILKVLRIARLLRIFRYLKSFRLLTNAIKSKRSEMMVSLQFLVIVTLILSFILFFFEHKAQPNVYDNGFSSVVWAFAQYIGDPGGFADTPPITFVGRIIACIIGILGIAIFAVPAGLIGAGFTEAMEDEEKKNQIKNNITSIVHTFKFEKDQQHTNLFIVPRYKELNTILTRKFISIEDIITAVKESDCLHLYNMANAMNAADEPEDKIVVINYKKNTPYGCCIDRGSKVTIVSTSGYTEPSTSWFAYHIAKLGGFNYVAKEIELDPDNPITYYNITNEDACPNMRLFLDDINRLSSMAGSWVIPILGAIGLKSRPEQFHFCYNSTKHDASYEDTKSRVKDFATFDKLYNEISSMLSTSFNYTCDKNKWYAVGSNNIAHHIKADNVFTLRVECFVWMFDNRYMAVIKSLADEMSKVLEPGIDKPIPPEMLSRPLGKDFGMQDYID